MLIFRETNSALHLKGTLKVRESMLANYETHFTSPWKFVVWARGTGSSKRKVDITNSRMFTNLKVNDFGFKVRNII